MGDPLWLVILLAAISSGFITEIVKTIFKRWKVSRGKSDRYKVLAMTWEFLYYEAKTIAAKHGAKADEFSPTPEDSVKDSE